MVQEPNRIFVKFPQEDYKLDMVLKSNTETFVEFCKSEGAPECYGAFEGLLLKEYLARTLPTIGKKNLLHMIGQIIDKIEAEN